MGMGKRSRKGGAEMDAFDPFWRHMLCYMKRGRPKIKRAARRRERRQAKQSGFEDF